MTTSQLFKKPLATFLIVAIMSATVALPKKASAIPVIDAPHTAVSTANGLLLELIEAETFVIATLAAEDAPVQAANTGSTFVATAKGIITAIATPLIQVNTALSSFYAAIQNLKEMVLDPIARLMSSLLGNMLVKMMFSFIGSGNSGAPAFLTNPQLYLGGVAQNTTGLFLNDLQYNTPQMMPSIREAVRQRIIAENYVNSQKILRSTFPGGDAAYQNYLRDPSTCPTGNSWDCYFAAMAPENNPQRVYEFQSEKLSKQRARDVALARDEIIAGSGYHSLKDCIEPERIPAGGGGSISGVNTNGGIGPDDGSDAWLQKRRDQIRQGGVSGGVQQTSGGGVQHVDISNVNFSGITPSSKNFDTGFVKDIHPVQVETASDIRDRDIQGGGPGTDIIDPYTGKSIGKRPALEERGGSGALTGNCSEYLTRTPGATIKGQTDLYLNNALNVLQNVHEVGDLITDGIGMVQSWMNGNGLTTVGNKNEAGTRAKFQGSGVKTFEYKGGGSAYQGGGNDQIKMTPI